MLKKRIKVCWSLLLAVLLAANMLLSIGVTQARYENTGTAVAIVKSPGAEVGSNCLVTDQDAPRTVLLGQMDLYGSTCVPFWLLASEADATEKLNWGVSDPQYTDYLNISVFAGFEELEANSELELLEDIRMDLLLCLKPTEKAITTVHERMTIYVHVTWGDEMWGTFQVVLPEVREKIDLGEFDVYYPEPEVDPPTEPSAEASTEPSTEPSTEASTEPSTEPSTEASTEPSTEPSTEASTEPSTEPSTEASTEPSTEPSTEASTEPSTEPSTEASTEPSTEPSTEASTEPSTEPSTEASAGSSSEPSTEPTAKYMKTLQSFNPLEQLPVLIELPKGITTIRLGVQTEREKITSFEAFPDYTMFSLDGGASYYMLYGGYIPEFTLDDVTAVPVLLDFRYAKLDCIYEDTDENEKMNLAMETYVEGVLSETDVAVIEIHDIQSGKLFVNEDQQRLEAELPGPVLTFDNNLEFIFPLEWEDAELNYSVERLTMTEDQTLTYVPVTVTKDGVDVVYTCTQYVHRLVLQLGEQFTTPGTYRINMTWTYEDICFWNKQITFFINGSALMDGAMSSQEVPNDN